MELKSNHAGKQNLTAWKKQSETNTINVSDLVINGGVITGTAKELQVLENEAYIKIWNENFTILNTI